MADIDEPSITVNGVEVTARMLAEARQELARRSPFNAGFYPAFSELTEQEQRTSEIEARNYLRALVAIAPATSRPYVEGQWTKRGCDGCGREVAARSRTARVLCTTCDPADLPLQPSGDSAPNSSGVRDA